MSFSRDTFTKKLITLEDTQESIVSISQWVFFHSRHSKECAKIWSDFALKVPSTSTTSSASLAKLLSLLHLCNDVVQRARRKKKLEFIEEFAKVLPVVLVNCYGALDQQTKTKIDRLISVWSERFVFSPAEIKKLTDAIEASKNSSKAKNIKSEVRNGNPVNTSTPVNLGSVAPELTHLNDLYSNLNKLSDISQSNLTQFGIQSKTYLPHDPETSENLPSPKVYISKLNMLEKLGKISLINIKEIQNVKGQVVKQLHNLIKLIDEPSNTDSTKVQIITDKLSKLYKTREELQEMLEEDSSNNNKVVTVVEEEEPSPAYDESSDDDIPTYEDDEEEKEESPQPPLRKRLASPSGGSTPTSKRVAFAEDIEVKEFDREDGSNVMSIAYTDDHNDSDYDNITSDNTSVTTPGIPAEFHAESEDDYARDESEDDYDPAAGLEEAPAAIDVMSLLDRLG